MENKKSIFGDFVKSLIIICIAIVLVLSGYAARKYIEFRKNDNCTKETTIKKDETNITAKEADEMYKEYIANIKENMSKDLSKNTTINYRGEDLDLGNYYIELTNDYELYLHGAADTEYEVSKDVVQAFLVQSGQAGNSLLYFVKSDGKLYSANPGEILDTKKIASKELTYKNIVNVMPGNFSDDESGYTGPIFIDIEGNIVK